MMGTATVAIGLALSSWPSARADGSAAEGPLPTEVRPVLLLEGEDGGGATRGTLKAEVIGIDLSRGAALVTSDAGERLLRGTPSQLLGLSPGDTITIHFRNYGSEDWLWPRAERVDVQRFATFGSLTGPVEGLDPARGAVRVGGQTLFAHPDDVADLAPGERVTLRFARVGAALWALFVERREGAATAATFH